MFARTKKSGRYEYLQIVENTKSGGKVSQRVIATVGRLDQLQAKGGVESLVRSLARFSSSQLLVSQACRAVPTLFPGALLPCYC